LDAVGPKDQGQGSGAPDDPDAGLVRDCMEQQWGEDQNLQKMTNFYS
jgi:hypothetical protein